MKKLNLGCGHDIKEGYINLDFIKLKGVDVVADVEKGLPFQDNYFDEIICFSLLEHTQKPIAVLKEIARVLKIGGVVKIKVPHFSSSVAYMSIDHYTFYTYYTFDILSGHQIPLKVIKKKLYFGKKYNILNYIIEPIANLFPRFYEDSFLRVFPALGIYVELEKVKKI